jgi:hypothetical protein
MAEATGFILRLPDPRLDRLRNQLSLDETFAEPVSDFEYSRQAVLVCFVEDEQRNTLYIAYGRRGLRAGTGLRRLNLFSFVQLGQPVRLERYVPSFPPRLRKHFRDKVSDSGLLTPKQFRALVDAIIPDNEELGSILARYSSARANRLASLPTRIRQQLAFEKEAMGTALSLAGLDRSSLSDWDPPSDGRLFSFMSGLRQVRLREDAMIFNDLMTLPGFSEIRRFIQGSTEFRDDQGTRLTIVLANRQPLEELTGADLIYYNETFKSFVMVQYKAMERSAGSESIFRLPNPQLDHQIARMQELVESIRPYGVPADSRGYRLLWNPFFLKLCPRIVFEPDSAGLTPGMYLPLDNFRLLVAAEATTQQKGWRGITFANVGRYLDNTHFIMLVAKAWIGTTPAQSSILKDAVLETISNGRAALLAVRSRTPQDQESARHAPVDVGDLVDLG